MMALAQVMEMVAPLEETGDVMVDLYGTDLHLTVNDFEGFDEEWDEVFREYDEDAVDALLDTLEEEALFSEGDYYRCHHFEEFTVQVGYTSFDI